MIDDEESAAFVKTDINTRPVLYLYQMASENDLVSEVELNRAMQLLPDKTELLKLAIVETKTSIIDVTDVQMLTKHSMKELMDELIFFQQNEFYSDAKFSPERIEEALNCSDAKGSLVSLIMSNSTANTAILNSLNSP